MIVLEAVRITWVVGAKLWCLGSSHGVLLDVSNMAALEAVVSRGAKISFSG